METIIEKTTKQDQRIARASISQFTDASRALHAGTFVEIKIRGEESFLKIPKKAFYLLGAILGNMAEGKSNALLPSEVMLSTQQAAEFLNVSRPHLIKLLEKGEIGYTKVGTHRRIELIDLVEYKRKLKTNRSAQLDFLAKQAQNLNLGY